MLKASVEPKNKRTPLVASAVAHVRTIVLKPKRLILHTIKIIIKKVNSPSKTPHNIAYCG